jgi:Taurine catabolism dioxygenase TauD, TfdA family
MKPLPLHQRVVMASGAIDSLIHNVVGVKQETLGLPHQAKIRFEIAGINLSNGHPYLPEEPLCLQDVYSIQNTERKHVDPGIRTYPAKNALSTATKVTDLRAHNGAEIKSLQLKGRADKQKHELRLPIEERGVVIFRDQDINPQQQKELEVWYGEIEIHENRFLHDFAESGIIC